MRKLTAKTARAARKTNGTGTGRPKKPTQGCRLLSGGPPTNAAPVTSDNTYYVNFNLPACPADPPRKEKEARPTILLEPGLGKKLDNLLRAHRRCDPPPLLLCDPPPPPLGRGAGADRSRTIGGLIRTDCGALLYPLLLAGPLLNLCQPPPFD